MDKGALQWQLVKKQMNAQSMVDNYVEIMRQQHHFVHLVDELFQSHTAEVAEPI